MRDGLECRRPDIDGRKTRWKKGQPGLERELDSTGGFVGQSGEVVPRVTEQGNLEGHYTGGLLDLLMGEHNQRPNR